VQNIPAFLSLAVLTWFGSPAKELQALMRSIALCRAVLADTALVTEGQSRAGGAGEISPERGFGFWKPGRQKFSKLHTVINWEKTNE